MAQTDDTTPLSLDTAFSATERSVLPAWTRPMLLGTYLKPSGDTALICLPDGEVHLMGIGAFIGQARITAIGMGEVQLSLLSQVHRLTIPA